MKTHIKGRANALIRKITWVYSIFLVIFGLLASFLAYDKESTALETELTQTMSELSFTYESSVENFWRFYIPVVEADGKIYNAFKNYFSSSGDEELSQEQKLELRGALSELMSYNHGVSWVAVYSAEREINYMKYHDTLLVQMPDDFPYIEEMQHKSAFMEVYGGGELLHNGQVERTIALCGNASITSNQDMILFGYKTDAIYKSYESPMGLTDVRFYVVNDHGVIFDSSGNYDRDIMALADSDSNSAVVDGVSLRIHRLEKKSGGYQVFCTVPLWQEQLAGHTYSPYILLVVILFWVCSLMVYRWTSRGILRKIRVIQYGLHTIGDSNLEYRLPVSDPPRDEFEDISRSINEMTAQLQENINKTYELRLQQREAELSELQAKFDPHFLYNTLEVIRGKVYENGDMETSDVITKMAQLFRTLLSADNFVSIRDEIDYCNSYLSLMEYRYDDQIDVIYDIESEVMQYGIIRNLLQPLLENFFVHGIDETKFKHTLRIRGKVYDENYIWFYLQNDGLTIPEERLRYLQESLLHPDESGKSYGLRNVQRRTKLFYGPDCGLTLRNNPDRGVTVELKIRKLTLDEHMQRLNKG